MQARSVVRLKLGAVTLGALGLAIPSTWLLALGIVCLWAVVIDYEASDRQRRREARPR